MDLQLYKNVRFSRFVPNLNPNAPVKNFLGLYISIHESNQINQELPSDMIIT